MSIVCADRDRAEAIANGARGTLCLTITCLKRRLSTSSCCVPFNPQMVATVRDILAKEGDFINASRRTLVQKEHCLVVTVIWIV